MCFTIRGVLHKRYLPRPLDLLKISSVILSSIRIRFRGEELGTLVWLPGSIIWVGVRFTCTTGMEKGISKSQTKNITATPSAFLKITYVYQTNIVQGMLYFLFGSVVLQWVTGSSLAI